MVITYIFFNFNKCWKPILLIFSKCIYWYKYNLTVKCSPNFILYNIVLPLDNYSSSEVWIGTNHVFQQPHKMEKAFFLKKILFWIWKQTIFNNFDTKLKQEACWSICLTELHLDSKMRCYTFIIWFCTCSRYYENT